MQETDEEEFEKLEPREEDDFDEDLQQYMPEPQQPYDASFWNYNLLLTMQEQPRRAFHKYIDDAPFHKNTKDIMRFAVDTLFSMDSVLTTTLNLTVNELHSEIISLEKRNSILAVDAEKKEFHYLNKMMEYWNRYGVLPRTYGDAKERNQQGRQIVGVEKRSRRDSGDGMYSEKKES